MRRVVAAAGDLDSDLPSRRAKPFPSRRRVAAKGNGDVPPPSVTPTTPSQRRRDAAVTFGCACTQLFSLINNNQRKTKNET
jgi:anti-sigma factor RsiW